MICFRCHEPLSCLQHTYYPRDVQFGNVRDTLSSVSLFWYVATMQGIAMLCSSRDKTLRGCGPVNEVFARDACILATCFKIPRTKRRSFPRLAPILAGYSPPLCAPFFSISPLPTSRATWQAAAQRQGRCCVFSIPRVSITLKNGSNDPLILGNAPIFFGSWRLQVGCLCVLLSCLFFCRRRACMAFVWIQVCLCFLQRTLNGRRGFSLFLAACSWSHGEKKQQHKRNA